MNISFAEEVEEDVEVGDEVGPHSANAEDEEHDDDEGVTLLLFRILFWNN
jgi:hypothetical protein